MGNASSIVNRHQELLANSDEGMETPTFGVLQFFQGMRYNIQYRTNEVGPSKGNDVCGKNDTFHHTHRSKIEK
jgi:hypothetical protein